MCKQSERQDMMNLSIKKSLKKRPILKRLRKILRKILKAIRRFSNGLGSKRKCYICGKTFSYFTKYRGGSKGESDFRKQIDKVDSDFDNFGCMYCGCKDRERHLFMFFDKLMLWENMENWRILHFAPEICLLNKISEQAPLEYVKADLYPKNSDIMKINATAIPFSNDTFDFLIANHILEHIPDYRRALSEFYRILKPGGIAVLQTPYSKLLRNNFEDEGINSDELRFFFHGETVHVRTFGEKQFLKSLKDTGFSLQIKKHVDFFDAKTGYYYGVPIKEDLIMVAKQIGK
jgi:SAM-dependent methyltransferase